MASPRNSPQLFYSQADLLCPPSPHQWWQLFSCIPLGPKHQFLLRSLSQFEVFEGHLELLGDITIQATGKAKHSGYDVTMTQARAKWNMNSLNNAFVSEGRLLATERNDLEQNVEDCLPSPLCIWCTKMLVILVSERQKQSDTFEQDLMLLIKSVVDTLESYWASHSGHKNPCV